MDRLAALVLFVGFQLELWLTDGFHGPKALTLALAVLMTVPLAFRRRAPLAVATTVVLANGVSGLIAGPQESIAWLVAWIYAVYGLAVWIAPRAFAAGLAITTVSITMVALGPGGDFSEDVLWIVSTLLVTMLVRRVVRERQLRADALEQRARLLERERDLQAREAVLEERARIARELHDVVAHAVSVIVVQAGAERRTLAPELAGTREVLVSIEQTGRAALAEMRRLLGMLRQDSGEPTLAPQPTLSRLEPLVEHVRAAGLAVDLSVEGERTRLSPGLDVSAYRIVQEALTNALRHAGAARVEVVVRYGASELAVAVRDDGRGSANGNGRGHGLVGMRERAALYGGRVEAGPGEEGGFEVLVRLPLEASGRWASA